MRHAEAEQAFAALGDRLLGARGAHHHRHPGGHADRRFPALADSGRILGRDPAPVLDRFALAEEEGHLLARGLSGGEPQQRAGVRSALVIDDDLPGVGPQRDGQRRAQIRVFRAHLERQRLLRAVGDALDFEPVVVEHDLPGVRPAIDVQRGRATDAPGVEVDREVERDMGHARYERTRETVRVDRVGRSEDRGDRGLGGGRRLVGRLLSPAAGGEENRGEQRRAGEKLHAVPSNSVRHANAGRR